MKRAMVSLSSARPVKVALPFSSLKSISQRLSGVDTAQVVEHVRRPDALAIQVLDDAQLGLHLLLEAVELVHLAHLSVVLLDLPVDLLDLRIQRTQGAALHEERDDHDQQRDGNAEGDQRQLLAPPDGALGLFQGEEIDADHLSPGRRTDSPRATANSEARRCSAAASIAGPSAMRLKGSVTSTGASMRSASRCASSGVCAAPPLR